MKRKEFYQYMVYEDGSVINTLTNKKVSVKLNKNKLEIRLVINNKPKIFLLHRLIYCLFVEEFDLNDKNLCVKLKDNSVTNLSKDNLELIHKKDILHGEKSVISKLTNKEVEEIRELYKGQPCTNQFDKGGGDLSYRDLAQKYNVSKASIGRIIRGESRNQDIYKLK